MAAMCNAFERLHIKRTEFVGESLNLKGYYFNLQHNRYKIVFLFSNGVYLEIAAAAGAWSGR
jgi:hypothetical protein